MPVYSLSIHADYGCRHSGACCRTSWDVPVEVPIYRLLEDALAEGRLHAAAPFLNVPPPPEGAAAVLRRDHGGCVFLDRESRLCAVHRELGAGALPSTCRLFPRIAVADRRGTFITLSHYCPTAASMLFRTDVPLEVVEAPLAFPPGDYEGLDARTAWPPLLRPGVLMDHEDYDAWERHAVARCAGQASPDAVVASLARDAEILRAWTPGGSRSLRETIAALPREIEPPLSPGPPSDLFSGFETVVNRYLAAHAFASWCAYQGHGLRTIVRGLETALATLTEEAGRVTGAAGRPLGWPLDDALLLDAIRAADWRLRHVESREELAREWSRVETSA